MKIEVNGGEYTARVDEEGVFRAVVDGVTYSAESLAELREHVRSGLHGVPVEIPFTAALGGLIRTGVARGIRRVDNAVLVVWDDDGSLGLLSWSHHVLRPLDEGEQDTYRRLHAQETAARQALERFERARAIDVKQEIKAARRKAADATASKTAPVHMARYTETGRVSRHAVCGNPDGLIAGQDSAVTCTSCLAGQDAQYTEARG